MPGDLFLKWTRTGRVPSYQLGAPIPYRKWTPRADPVLCVSGWHACRWEDALNHMSDELWVCELGDPIVEGTDKVVGSRLRIVRKVPGIDDRSLRLFAADCAEDVLPLFESVCPGDDRPRLAIEASRAYADGEIRDAARVAARDAADAAARVAARDAADAAVWDAARYDAAGDAARVAARAAARAAAGYAARAAARAAADAAAGYAAWYAARAAADAAHRAAADAAQTVRLLSGYGGLNPDDFTHRNQ